MKAPKKLMLGIGLTAATAVAMTPVVKNMMEKRSNTQMSSGSNTNKSFKWFNKAEPIFGTAH